MPQFASKYFGTIDYPEDAIIQFRVGMPGFEEERRFLIVEQEANKPLVFLQSLSRPELCFMTLPTQVVMPQYRLQMEPEDLQLMGFPADRQPVPGQEVVSLAILAVNENEAPTANLLAPIVINLKTRQALQAIQANAGYSHRHPLEER